MLRQLHSLPGLIAALAIVVSSMTGAVLSLIPVVERAGSFVTTASEISVADLAGKVADHYPGVEQIERRPSGSVIVYYTQGDRVGADLVDPRTGQGITPYEPSSFSRWVKKLHRSFLLDMPGRAVAGISAVLVIVLTISGTLLLVTRIGGWRYMLQPVRGTLSQRLHAELGRVAIGALLLSALTGLYLSAVTLGLIPEKLQTEPAFPYDVAGSPPAPIETLPALMATDLINLRELVYPYPGDPTDLYSLSTSQGAGYIDQSSGEFLTYLQHGTIRNIHEFIYMLHTGEGLWWLGLILGLASSTVPVMAATGALIWWRRYRTMPRLVANSELDVADTVILVGSEGNTTWRFAKTLHEALIKAEHRVHTAPMNELASHYRSAKWLIILTATYGDGEAPSSANQFLERLRNISGIPEFRFAVLGFGDRQFPQFCQFAKDIEAALIAKEWLRLLPLDTINRQSPQEFARWGNAVGNVIGTELTLIQSPTCTRTTTLELTERVDYGTEGQDSTAVLRFKTPEGGGKNNPTSRFLRHSGLPDFEAGDLVGILPTSCSVPRFYSLASASKDGTLEICVRKHPGGLCSGFLHALPVGGTIEAFIQPNRDFRPASGKAPIVLIGAGTGIGPLIGFIRHNTAKHPMHLYWGGRCPQSDFLYESELNTYLADKRLTTLSTSFSRVSEGSYVQDKIAVDSSELRRLIGKGAQILVCGGRDMARSVLTTLEEIIAPLGIDVLTLKVQGRYREDIY